MSVFYRRFLLEEVKRSRSFAGRQVCLAAFGKHPGWDDHIDDIGLETESLVLAKKLLYVEGIGGQIDGGAWEHLSAEQQLPGFEHWWVWRRAGQFLIGRLWSSTDGKGRSRYPMIVCAHTIGTSLYWAVQHVLPCLQEVEQACRNTSSAADVRSVLQKALASLRQIQIHTAASAPDPGLAAAEREAFLSRPEWRDNHPGLVRITHAIQTQMPGFQKTKNLDRDDLAKLPSQQIRVPQAAATLAVGLLVWQRFLGLFLDPDVPALMLAPLSQPWLDIVVGKPSPRDFFALRASVKTISPVSDIPYTLDAAIEQNARAAMAVLGQQLLDPNFPAQSNEPGPKSSGTFSSMTTRLWKLLAFPGHRTLWLGLFALSLRLSDAFGLVSALAGE